VIFDITTNKKSKEILFVERGKKNTQETQKSSMDIPTKPSNFAFIGSKDKKKKKQTKNK